MQHRRWHLLLSILGLLFFAPGAFCAITGLTALPTAVTYSAFSGSTTTRTDTAPLILAAGTGSANVTISTSGGAWLTAQLSSGTITGGGHVSVTIKANPTGLQPSTFPTTYNGTVTVTSGTFSANIAVSFVIYQGTDATFTNLPAFPLTVPTGTNQTHTVSLTVVGDPNPTQDQHFHYSATTVNGTNWLTAAINGASALNFTVTGTVPAGAYAGVVEIDDNQDGAPYSQYFNVSMIVPAPTPAVTTISPNSASAGAAAFTLTVNGSGFQNNSTVQWNGSPVATTFVSASQLTAAIPANLMATAGSCSVTVLTSGAPVSNALTFTVNPVTPLTITGLNPNSATAGGSSLTLSVTGTGFVNGSIVQWNGSALTTGYQSSTQLLASVAANLIASPGNASVTVLNPGGATSNAATFTINSPAPIITSLSPNSASAGTAAFTLTVNGFGFVSGSAVQWNGSALTTSYQSSTQVLASVAANLIASSGNASVTVLNPGGAASNAATFTINSQAPIITTLSPNSASSGAAAFTLTVNGSGFVSGSTVQWNGSAVATTFVSASQLTGSIPANLIATAGSASVTVLTSGAPVSNAVTFTVNAATALTVASLSPSSAIAGGSSLTLSVTGTGFVNGSTVQWNGSSLTTSYQSSTQLLASVAANLIASPGNASVSVLNPGGVISNATTFTINSPAPIITSLSPNSASAGAAAFTLTVNGSGFQNNSTVQWNGSAIATNFVNAGQLSTAIPASLIAAAGNCSVTVLASGAPVSNALTFTVNPVTPLTVTGLGPNSATAGGSSLTLSVTGTGFVNGSIVQWNGSALTTSYQSSTQLLASVAANLIASPGNASVSVLNPGGATSNTATFTINSPAPIITSLSPNSASAGAAAFTLTVNGFGFVSGSTVQWNGSALTTSYQSSTQLLASVAANLIASPGNVSVTVLNPGGVTSNTVMFAMSAGPLTPNVQTISHIADGQGWRSTIVLVNTDKVTASYTINFVQDIGGAGSGAGSVPWSPPLALGAAGGTIPVGGSVTIQTADADPKNLTEGWAQVVSNQSIGGTAIFRYDSDGQEAAVPLLTNGGAKLEIPYQVGNSFALGAALANPSATQTANITEVIRDHTGAQLSTRPITIAPMSHLATNPPALTPLTGSGVVEYDSNVNIFGLGIRLDVAAFTSIDAVLAQTASTKTISHIADGQGWRSTIVLVNTDTVTAPYTINFVQDTGGAGSGTGSVPWSPPLALGAASGTIPVGGSVTIQTADADPRNLTEGWAQVVSSQSIGGTAIFRYDTGGQEAAVPLLTTAGTSLEVPYQVGGGLALGVAIANPSATQTANVTEVIRDQTGMQLSSRSITIAPMSHFATNPPALAALTGSGVVEYDSNVNIYALGIRLNGSAFTSVRAVYK
jgi:hypothetical protein